MKTGEDYMIGSEDPYDSDCSGEVEFIPFSMVQSTYADSEPDIMSPENHLEVVPDISCFGLSSADKPRPKRMPDHISITKLPRTYKQRCEQRRVCNINHRRALNEHFRALLVQLPIPEETNNSEITTVWILEKAEVYCKELQEEYNKLRREKELLRQKTAKLKASIELCLSSFPRVESSNDSASNSPLPTVRDFSVSTVHHAKSKNTCQQSKSSAAFMKTHSPKTPFPKRSLPNLLTIRNMGNVPEEHEMTFEVPFLDEHEMIDDVPYVEEHQDVPVDLKHDMTNAVPFLGRHRVLEKVPFVENCESVHVKQEIADDEPQHTPAMCSVKEELTEDEDQYDNQDYQVSDLPSFRSGNESASPAESNNVDAFSNYACDVSMENIEDQGITQFEDYRNWTKIRLWEFIKILLNQPALYGDSITWLDFPARIFKITNTERVSKLWGRARNRPAMNYDKLSRSIRQYYRKGIITKSASNQRQVYQFCHPYGR